LSGRRLVWIVAPLLAAALVLQGVRAERLWRVSRIVAAVEQETAEMSLAGRVAKGKIEYHLQLLHEAERLVPSHVDVPVALGWQYMLTDRPEAAVRSFEEVLSIEPRPEIFANLVQAHMLNGDREAAAEAYRVALLLDPSLAEALRSFAALKEDRQTTGSH